MKRVAWCLLCFMLAMTYARGQNVSSSLFGTVVDPLSAVITGAEVQLQNQATGAPRSVKSNEEGIFRFLDLAPGTYNLTIQAKGFKGSSIKNIAIVASDTRDLGKVTLQVGAATETVAVTAAATPIQLDSGEVSYAITGDQLHDVATKGLDLFAYASLLPGVTCNSGGGGGGGGERHLRAHLLAAAAERHLLLLAVAAAAAALAAPLPTRIHPPAKTTSAACLSTAPAARRTSPSTALRIWIPDPTTPRTSSQILIRSPRSAC